MKKFVLILLLVLNIFCMNKNNESKVENKKKKEVHKMLENKKEKKIITYDKFNKKYNYYLGININKRDGVLNNFILNKEKKLEVFLISYENNDSIKKLLNNLTEEEKIFQLMMLMIGAKKEEINTVKFSNIQFINFFIDELRENRNGLLNHFHLIESDQKNKYILKILENNFTEEEIRIFFDLYYLNYEFGDYDIAGRYGLLKVDKIISEVEKIEPISSEEWVKREMEAKDPLFENIEEEIGTNIYVLKDNRIIILDNEDKPKKEIKIKDYKKVEIAVYKSILYIYDDDKIYEYSLKNLNDVKVIDLKDTEKK